VSEPKKPALRRKPKAPKAIDLPLVQAALTRLDELVARNPRLASKENRERLAKHLGDEDAHERRDGDDGREEEDSSTER
jgi:hypothetical protein